MIAAALVDWDALLQVIWVSLLAGVGLTAAFSVAIVSAARLSTARRGERPLTVVAYGALLLVSVALVAGASVGGLLIVVG